MHEWLSTPFSLPLSTSDSTACVEFSPDGRFLVVDHRETLAPALGRWKLVHPEETVV